MDIDAATTAAIMAAYRLVSPVAVRPLDGGVNNASYRIESASGLFFLKRYQTSTDRTSLAYEHRLLGWLASQPLSFAVPTPLPTRSDETLLRVDGSLYGLFAWLPGSAPVPTPGQAEAYGAALGELHVALAAFPTTLRPCMHSYGALDRVHPRVPDPEQVDLEMLGLPATATAAATVAWWQHEVRELWEFVRGPYRQLPWQVVHGDVAFVNSLFAGETLTAILDFEFAGPDVRAIDLAAALRALLRGHDMDAASALARALLRGYRRAITPTDAEIVALPMLIRLSSVVATLWWLGRDLAVNTTHASLDRLVRAQQLTQSLERHAATLQQWLGYDTRLPTTF